MVIKKNIATNEQGFVFNPSTGDSFRGNSMATEIIEWMKAGKTPSDIKNLMLEKYEAPRAVIEKDLDEFLSSLKEMGLINN